MNYLIGTLRQTQARLDYDRQQIEAMRPVDRPLVRCRLPDDTSASPLRWARIALDGNNPWLGVMVDGKEQSDRFGWILILEVLNNPGEPPVEIRNVDWRRYCTPVSILRGPLPKIGS